MSTTHTIAITFTMDGSSENASRTMDNLVAHITAIQGTRELKAAHTREVQQWWTNPVPLPPQPPMERQQAVRPEDEAEPTEEQMAAAREAFPAPSEEESDSDDDTVVIDGPQVALNQTVYATGDITLMDEEEQLTGTGGRDLCFPVYHFAKRYKRCLLVHTPKRGEDGIAYSVAYSGEPLTGTGPVVLGYWNETLGGYVVRPTQENVKEVCEWLDELNAAN